jgi:phage shock protein A
MADFGEFQAHSSKKSFWQRPEGVTGAIFLLGLAAGLGYLLTTGILATILGNVIYLSLTLMVLAAIVYMVLDPKMRGLVGYMYKSIMRTITGWFVTIDPIGILKNYIEDLQDNLGKMSKQIGSLRGQMRKMKDIMSKNNSDIELNLKLANRAQNQGNQKQMLLSTRKAARLKESNSKYAKLHKRMEVMYRILTKMYQNSEILLEDTKDQVMIKEQEHKAIKASHSAMKSAMSVISGDPDKRAMFDSAMEHLADDVANKVGEMEQFMEMSSNFMNSIDLQNGVFEEQGMNMLEEWEKKSTLMLMEGKEVDGLDLNSERPSLRREERSGGESKYDNLFG